MPGKRPERCTGGLEFAGAAVGGNKKTGIVAGIDHFDLARLGIQAQEDGGHISASCLFAFRQ